MRLGHWPIEPHRHLPRPRLTRNTNVAVTDMSVSRQLLSETFDHSDALIRALKQVELDYLCGGGSKTGSGTDGVEVFGSKPNIETDGITLFGSKPGGAGDGVA